MIHVLRAESTKFGSVRSLPVLAAVALGAAAVMAVVFVMSLPLTQGRSVQEMAPVDVVGAALVGIDVAAVVLIVLGASAAGSEYATGLAQPTFLLTPRRGRVVLAKAVVVGVVAAAVAAVAAAVCVLVGQAALGAAGIAAAPVDLRLVAGSALGPVFYALVGLFAAFVVRGTGGGVAVALGVLMLPALVGWVPGLDLLAPLLPAAAVHGVAGASDPGSAEYLTAAPAAVSLVGWTMLLGGIATWRVRARDV